MHAAVHDVHHGSRQGVCVGAAQIGIDRQAGGLRCGAGSCQGAAQDGVCAETALVGGAVGFDQSLVDGALIGCVHAQQVFVAFVVDVIYRLQNALAQVLGLVAVAQFHGLESAGGGARRNDGTTSRAVIQQNFDFDGGVTAGVQDLPAVNIDDIAHYQSS